MIARHKHKPRPVNTGLEHVNVYWTYNCRRRQCLVITRPLTFLLQQFVENLLETTVTEARSTAVSVARAQDAMDSRMSTLEAALSRAVTSNAEQQSTMTRRNAEQQTAMTSTIQSMAT